MSARLLLASLLALAACSGDAIDPLPAPRCADWGSDGVLQVRQFARVLGATRSVDGADLGLLTSTAFAVADAHGQLRASFGSGGLVLAKEGTAFTAVAARPGGGWLFAGTGPLVGVDANGSPDPTVCGGRLIAVGEASLIAERDGLILVANGGTLGRAVSAFHADTCAPATEFGEQGAVGDGFATDVAIDPATHVITVASVDAFSTAADLRVARYDATGQRLPGFGSDGVVDLGVATGDPRVATLPDGAVIVASGGGDGGKPARFARLDEVGLDPSFATDGIAEVAKLPAILAVAALPGGRVAVVSAGSISTLDTSGAVQPWLTIDASETSFANALALDAAHVLAFASAPDAAGLAACYPAP